MGDGVDDGDSLFKDGTLLTPREDGRLPDVPEGYAVVQGENGALILRKKRQRNLQKLGIGGFQVRRPWARVKDKEEDALDNYNTAEVTLQQLKEVNTSSTTPGGGSTTPTPTTTIDGAANDASKPKRKPQRRKAKNKLAETYPAYLQEAFFGRELLVKPTMLGDSLLPAGGDTSAQSVRSTAGSGSDSEPNDDVPIRVIKDPSIIHLSKEEVADLENRSRSLSGGVAQPVVVGRTTAQPVAISRQSNSSQAPVQSQAIQQPVTAAPGPPQRPITSQFAGRQPVKPELDDQDENDPLDDEEEEEEARALKDILPLAGDLLDSDDLVDSIMKEGDAGVVDGDVDDDQEQSEALDEATLTDDIKPMLQQQQQQQRHGDELTDILLSEHINLETMVVVSDSVGGLPNMDCKDVEDIFKGVLTDESQESQSADASAHFQMASTMQQQHPLPGGAPGFNGNGGMPIHPAGSAMARALSQQPHQGTASPGNVGAQQQTPQHLPPPCSPYFSEYSSSPGFSPAFSEPPPSPWPSSSSGTGVGMGDLGSDPLSGDGPATANQRNALKWEADEALGLNATISAVLFANTNHPELKRDFPGKLYTENYSSFNLLIIISCKLQHGRRDGSKLLKYGARYRPIGKLHSCKKRERIALPFVYRKPIISKRNR